MLVLPFYNLHDYAFLLLRLFLFYLLHSPDIFYHVFLSCLWHTSMLSVPLTRHTLSIYCLGCAPNIRYYQMLILLFRPG
jgi:hypothetical protein